MRIGGAELLLASNTSSEITLVGYLNNPVGYVRAVIFLLLLMIVKVDLFRRAYVST